MQPHSRARSLAPPPRGRLMAAQEEPQISSSSLVCGVSHSFMYEELPVLEIRLKKR